MASVENKTKTQDLFLPQFAAHAVIDLERQIKQMKRIFGNILSVKAHEVAVSLIRNAVHVMLPDNGEIYRSNAWGGDLPNSDECESFLGLPGPVTCFEYAWTHPKAPEDCTVGTKRITIAHDTRQTAENPLSDGESCSTQIFSLYYDEVHGHWKFYPMVYNLVQPLEVHAGPIVQHGLREWGIRASLQDLESGHFANPEALTEREKKMLGEIRSDINAVIQCCHALRAGASLEERRETSASRRWKFEKKGVAGFTYHVLKLPAHARVDRDRGEPLGTHASPRGHVRRSHIRKLPSGTLTFVRQCLVGNFKQGVVHKTYQVKQSDL